MRRLTPTTLALIAAGIIILGLVVLLVRGRSSGDQDKLSDQQVAGKKTDPDDRCASERTYDAIKREIFRQAGETRGSDQAVFDRLAAYAVVRMERPVMRSHDEDVGTVRCSGRLSLDLPPGIAVVGGRRTLAADIDYVLQPAADGSGDVVVLEGADAIVVPLATVARTGANLQPPNVPPPAAQAPPPVAEVPPGAPAPQPPPTNAIPPAAPVPQQPPVVREPAPEPEPVQTAARPSFNCRYARTRGEIAVCGDPGLASLDRQMASQFYRAVGSGNARQRELLRATRTRFLRYRDACRSDACIADAYRGRIAEIRDIMSGG